MRMALFGLGLAAICGGVLWVALDIRSFYDEMLSGESGGPASALDTWGPVGLGGIGIVLLLGYAVTKRKDS